MGLQLEDLVVLRFMSVTQQDLPNIYLYAHLSLFFIFGVIVYRAKSPLMTSQRRHRMSSCTGDILSTSLLCAPRCRSAPAVRQQLSAGAQLRDLCLELAWWVIVSVGVVPLVVSTHILSGVCFTAQTQTCSCRIWLLYCHDRPSPLPLWKL